MDNEQLLYLILWLVLISYIPLMILFYQARFIHPIKGRYPRAAIFGCCCSLATTTMDCFSIIFFGPCDLRNGFGIPCLLLWIDSINYRLAQLLFSYHIAHNIAELKDKKFEEWKFNWFTRNRYLVQPKFIFVLGAILLLCNILVSIYYVATSTVCVGPFQNFTAISIAIRLIFMCIMAAKMWSFSSDAFGMRSEFKLFIFVVFVQVVFGSLQSSFPGVKYYTAFLAMCGYQVMFFGSVLYPYYESRKVALEPDSTSLKDWLQLPDGIRLFSEYLRSEFSQENLFFYLEVEAFHTLPSADLERLKTTATDIWNKYIDPRAPYCVNLPSYVVELIQEKIQLLKSMAPGTDDPDFLLMFDNAQIEIYRLMSQDSFRRFQTTEFYIRPSKRVGFQNSIREVEILIQSRPGTRHEVSTSEEAPLADVSPHSQLELATPFMGPGGSARSFDKLSLEVLKDPSS